MAMKKITICIAAILISVGMLGCSNNYLSQNDTDNSIENDMNKFKNDPDYYEYPKVNKNEQIHKYFERVEGTWKADGKIVEFYIDGDSYRFNDHEYNQNAPIGELTISNEGKLTLIVGGGDMQVRIEGSISADNTKLILEDIEYSFAEKAAD